MICRFKTCGREVPDDAAFCPYCGRKQAVEKLRGKRPNGTGTVYKLSGNRSKPWAAVKGKQYIGYYATKKDAVDALGRVSDIAIDYKYNSTFSQIYDEWKLEHFRDLSDKGKEQYATSYKWFKDLHEKKFRDLRTKDFQQVVDAQAKSHSAASKLKQLIGQMYKYAIREGICTTNYAPYIKLPGELTAEKEIFSDAEIERLKADGSEEAQIVLMLIYTGMRINELFGLPLADYHGTYCIGGEKTKAGKNRVIPVPPAAQDYFSHFADKADTLLIDGFAGNKNTKNFTRREYADLMDRCKITGKTPHCTRHTYASRAAASGMRQETLQKILGHASFTTTANVYIHSDVDALVSAASDVWK